MVAGKRSQILIIMIIFVLWDRRIKVGYDTRDLGTYFDNLVKVSKHHKVIGIPLIDKPENIVYE